MLRLARARSALFTTATLAGLSTSACSNTSSPAAAIDSGTIDDTLAQPDVDPDSLAALDPSELMSELPSSCAFDCAGGCPAEKTGPFVCPTLLPWAQLPHDVACGSAAPTSPTPTIGHCTADLPTGAAVRKAGPIAGASSYQLVLPDGHAITPLGHEAILADATHVGGFPVSVRAVAGTDWAITVDAGFGDHLVRNVSLSNLEAGKTVIASTVVVQRANWGLQVIPDAASGKHRVYVSGGALGEIWSLSLDDATGALTLDDAATISLGTLPGSGPPPAPYFSSGIALSADGTRLVAASVASNDLRFRSLATATYGKDLGGVSVSSEEQFTVAIDPADTTGTEAWVTLWGGNAIAAIDIATSTVRATVPVSKNPQGFTFLSPRWLVVMDADGDALTLVDRVAASAAATIAITDDSPAHARQRAVGPSAVVFDASASRLYVAEAVLNAVEVFDVDLTATPPTIVSKGRIPTSWWPTDLALASDRGDLLVLNGRGHGVGTGRTGKPFSPGNGEIAESMSGTLQLVSLASLDLAAASAQVDANTSLAQTIDYGTVHCDAGAANDFPVPLTNTAGPSTRIGHVLWVIRENKNFDGVLGDVSGVDGDATRVLSPGHMEDLWPNFRAIGRKWTFLDNYYTDAEYSSQGHVWATFGRTTDFTERSWMIAAAGKGRAISGGITPVGNADEGSLFQWILDQGQKLDILGEATGLPEPPAMGNPPLDGHYPGIAQNVGLEDLTKACYFAGRARVMCDYAPFIYMTLPNDHTFGGNGGRPTPETMIAVNDEATGMVLDALSHSPFWNDALVIVTEDDPQD
ncbi:MAG: YncE family protein, partial [Polyangiales bacterium]